MGMWVVYIAPTTFRTPEMPSNLSITTCMRSIAGHCTYLGSSTSLMAAHTSRINLWQVEMPRPKRFDTSLRGSPVASLQMQTATLCFTGMAALSMVSSLATKVCSSSHIRSNVPRLIRKARWKSASGNPGWLHCSHLPKRSLLDELWLWGHCYHDH